MWIRTQNKEDLIKCQKISIIGPGKDVYLLVELTNDNYIELGIYKSKERALEVLDEIQAYLENNYVAISDMPQHNNNPWIDYCPRYITRTTKTVYQMPKERLNEKDKM